MLLASSKFIALSLPGCLGEAAPGGGVAKAKEERARGREGISRFVKGSGPGVVDEGLRTWRSAACAYVKPWLRGARGRSVSGHTSIIFKN